MAFNQAINGLNFQNWLSQQVLGSKGVSPEMDFIFNAMIRDELGDGTIVDPIPQPLSSDVEIYPPVPKDETEGKITEPIDWERIRQSYQPEVIPEYDFKPEDFIITDPIPQMPWDEGGVMKSEQSENPTLEEYVKGQKPLYHAGFSEIKEAKDMGRGAIYLSDTIEGAKSGGRAGQTLPESGVVLGIPDKITEFTVDRDAKIFGKDAYIKGVDFPEKVNEEQWKELLETVKNKIYSSDVLVNNRAREFAKNILLNSYDDVGNRIPLKESGMDWEGFEHRDERNNKQLVIEALKSLGYDGAYVADEGGQSLAILNPKSIKSKSQLTAEYEKKYGKQR
jgi:hypothetical protein